MEIREIQKTTGITAIYVTHDQAEALAISDTIIVMNHGVIMQKDTPRGVYDYPCTKFVADFIGAANIIPAKIEQERGEFVEVTTPIGRLVAKNTCCSEDKEVALCIRPEDLNPVLNGSQTKDSNIITGKIKSSVYMGNMLDLFFISGDQTIRASVSKDYIIEEGITINFAIPFDKVLIVAGDDV